MQKYLRKATKQDFVHKTCPLAIVVVIKFEKKKQPLIILAISLV